MKIYLYIYIFIDLLQCTNEPNVSIPHLADLLIERTYTSGWVPVFKALVTLHALMNYGNEVRTISMNTHNNNGPIRTP